MSKTVHLASVLTEGLGLVERHRDLGGLISEWSELELLRAAFSDEFA